MFPLLPEAFEEPRRASEVIRSMLSFADAAIAIDRGQLLGFLTAFDSEPDPASPMARYSPARSALHLVQGHAVAEGADAHRVYAALFARLAERALERGIVDHVVHVPIGDPSTEHAWSALGFGRMNVVALRALQPEIAAADESDVTVRLAAPEELDIVERLVDEEAVFHAGSPIFRPYVRDATREAVRAELTTALASDDHAFLIARRGDGDVGVISVGPGIGSPLYIPDRGAYIAATAVLPEERGSGAGAALVRAALAWAGDRGYAAACLHFSPANATSTSFWTGLGFTPAMAHLRRRLDDRILTSRPTH